MNCHTLHILHKVLISTAGLILSHDDESMFSCGDDGIIKEWEVPSLKQLEDMDLDNANESGNLVPLGDDDVTALAKSITVRLWSCVFPRAVACTAQKEEFFYV